MLCRHTFMLSETFSFQFIKSSMPYWLVWCLWDIAYAHLGLSSSSTFSVWQISWLAGDKYNCLDNGNLPILEWVWIHVGGDFVVRLSFCNCLSCVYNCIDQLCLIIHIILCNSIMVFKCMNGLAPGYLSDQFVTRSSISTCKTRNSLLLHLPLFKTTTGQRTFNYRMVSLWNALPQYIKLS